VRFALEVINVVVETIGAEWMAIRISPWSKFQCKDPLPTFTTSIGRVRDLTNEDHAQSNEVLQKIWGDRPYIAAGGMDGATATNTAEKYGVAFGRHFIANEGQHRITASERTEAVAGYIDYPFAITSLVCRHGIRE